MKILIFMALQAFAILAQGQELSSFSLKLETMKLDTTKIQFAPTFNSERRAAKGQISGAAYKYETFENLYKLRVLRGLTEQSTITAETLIGNRSSNSEVNGYSRDYSYSGMGDISVEYKYLQNRSSVSHTLLGTTLSFSLADHTVANRIQPGNLASGGHSLRPFMGYETQTYLGVAGFEVTYQIFGPRTWTYRNPNPNLREKETLTGGNILSMAGFFETIKGGHLIGGSLGYSITEPSESKINSEIQAFDSSTHLLAQVYGRMGFSEGFDLSPVLSYKTLISNHINNLKYSENSELALQLKLGLLL